jgi:hypothetical protein
MARASVAVLILAGLLAATNSFSQAVSQSAVLEQMTANLFRSSDDSDRAWAVWLAARLSQKKFEPELRNLLHAGATSDHLKQALLDAFIQMNLAVVSEDVVPLYPEFPDEVIILLAKQPEAHRQQLLAMFEETLPLSRWLAIANPLAAMRTAGFAFRLIRPLEIKLTIQVGHGYPPGSAGSGFRGDSCRPLAMSAAYPPIGDYHLTQEPFAGAVLASAGPHPVYYERAVAEPNRVCWRAGANETSTSHNDYRLDYIAALLGASRDQLQVSTVTPNNLDWLGPAQFSKDVQHIIVEQQTRFATLLEHLQERGLLDASEAKALGPNLKFELIDLRPDKSVALTLPVFP